uniref:pilus assembly PilX family protein n=1 Tax=Rheinheimera sp. TaxID=1869214 RepID=UPI004048A01F
MNITHMTNSKQQGVALIVSLLLLVAITLLATSAMRGTIIQEKMASNLYDRELAMQAAERALIAAEQLIVTGAPFVAIPPRIPTAGMQEAWEAPPAGFGWITVAAGQGLPAAEYIIEDLDIQLAQPGCLSTGSGDSNVICRLRAYRLTARTAPIDGRASVMLQTTVGLPI